MLSLCGKGVGLVVLALAVSGGSDDVLVMCSRFAVLLHRLVYLHITILQLELYIVKVLVALRFVGQ
jgi:hypothetical protein